MKAFLAFLFFLFLPFSLSAEPQVPLSQQLRERAISYHEPDLDREVDREAFRKWKFSMDEYLGYLLDMQTVHVALEEAIYSSSDPLLKELQNLDLERAEAFSRDLYYIQSRDIGIPKSPSESATAYAHYLRSLTDRPHLLMSHFYVLQFSALSGGRKIAEKAADLFSLPQEGMHSSMFAEERGLIKNHLRQSFDSLTLLEEQKSEILDEVGVAFIRLTTLIKRLDHSSYALFAAVQLPPQIVNEIVTGLTHQLPYAIWPEAETYHIVIRYIKQIDLTEAGGFRWLLTAYRAMNEINFHPFSLSLEKISHVPEEEALYDKSRGWLYVGVGQNGELFALRENIDQALSKYGIEQENNAFNPHVTVARLNGTPFKALAGYLLENKNFATEPFQVDCFELMLSCHKKVRAIFQIESDWMIGATRVKSDPDLIVKKICAKPSL